MLVTNDGLWVLGIGQTKQIEMWVLADQTDRNVGVGQTKQTEMWVLARLEIANGQTEGGTQIFSRLLSWVIPEHPVRDPNRSGQYLSWVRDLILGHKMYILKGGKYVLISKIFSQW